MSTVEAVAFARRLWGTAGDARPDTHRRPMLADPLAGRNCLVGVWEPGDPPVFGVRGRAAAYDLAFANALRVPMPDEESLRDRLEAGWEVVETVAGTPPRAVRHEAESPGGRRERVASRLFFWWRQDAAEVGLPPLVHGPFAAGVGSGGDSEQRYRLADQPRRGRSWWGRLLAWLRPRREGSS